MVVDGGSRIRHIVLAILLVASGVALFGQTPARATARPIDGSGASQCDAAPADSLGFVSVPGNPFQALPSADGCWVLVSLTATSRGGRPGIALLRNTEGTLRLERVLPIADNPTGMALTHDGKLLIAASGKSLTFVDVDRLIGARSGAVIGTIAEGPDFGRIYVSVTSDDRYLFASNEGTASITVIDLRKARSTGFDPNSVIGEIPTGRAPIALTFSPDEKLLYTTSQVAPDWLRWPIDCRPQAAASVNAAPNHRHGAIVVVDVERAIRDPAHSVVSVVRAGCNPVRLVLSPSGDVAYVSARTDNALLAFDTRRLVGDTTGALIATVAVGPAPVGLAVIEDGAKLLVTNSNRFAGGADDRQTVTVVDASKVRLGSLAILGSVPAGAFPREMRMLPGGHVLLLTNFNSSSIELIDLTRLPIAK